MTCMDKMNNALDYIELNITDEIDLNQVAREAYCSVDHFLRMFSFIAEISLSEYIRRRRLTLAAFDLLENGAKIIDVAVKYGYNSPAAFSRAFKGLHGISPNNIRNTDMTLKAYPKLSFCMELDGSTDIGYRIVHKQAHEVCGITTDIPRTSGKANDLITNFWETNIQTGVLGQFHRDLELPDDICLNAALFNHRHDAFSYMICYEAPYLGAVKGYSRLSVPPLTWAVFSTPEHSSQETTALVRRIRERIALEWFPTSAYIPVNGPEFEIFSNKLDKFVVDIWVPVTKALTNQF